MDALKRWLLSIVMQKMVVSLSKSVVALATTYGIALVASYGGYTIDLADQAGMAILINAGLKGLFHTLSHKYPSLAWLSPQDEVVPVLPESPTPELCKTVLPE